MGKRVNERGRKMEAADMQVYMEQSLSDVIGATANDDTTIAYDEAMRFLRRAQGAGMTFQEAVTKLTGAMIAGFACLVADAKTEDDQNLPWAEEVAKAKAELVDEIAQAVANAEKL